MLNHKIYKTCYLVPKLYNHTAVILYLIDENVFPKIHCMFQSIFNWLCNDWNISLTQAKCHVIFIGCFRCSISHHTHLDCFGFLPWTVSWISGMLFICFVEIICSFIYFSFACCFVPKSVHWFSVCPLESSHHPTH